ncbi:MAG TPA: efflux RND transporter periplasmic adaptor subunit [Blastocatellia bacterium]|nr:efflux RND transporter periplasmic adaptor subunit [Blastocatellia bacterium]
MSKDLLTTLNEDIRSLQIDRQRAYPPPRSRRRWLVVIGGLILVGGIGGVLIRWMPFGSRLGGSAKEVSVAVAARRGPTGPQPILSAGGYIIARNQVEVGAKITGRVVALEVKEGDVVRAGQVIARLDDEEIRAQVRQAEANLAAARARLAELEAGSRPQEIDRARAEMLRAEADVKNAELNLRRLERLVEAGVVDRQRLDDARARYEMATAALRAAQENYELVRIGPRPEQIELARAQVHQAESALAYARAQLENTVIRAPVSGTVLDRYVDLGEMVTIGFTSTRGAKQALISLADVTDLQVELDISEADIARVKLQQPTTITPDAYPDRRYRGVVEYISAVADRQKATIKVKVKVLDPDEYLRPDMGAKVTFYETGTEIPRESSVVLVPKTAVIEQGNRTIVFLVREGKAVAQPVSVGKENAGYCEIVSGLQGGETVITGGLAGLKDGDRVTVRP